MKVALRGVSLLMIGGHEKRIGLLNCVLAQLSHCSITVLFSSMNTWLDVALRRSAEEKHYGANHHRSTRYARAVAYLSSRPLAGGVLARWLDEPSPLSNEELRR